MADAPLNKLARIVAILDAAEAPMSSREVTAALGLPTDRKHICPVSGGISRLEKLGIVRRVPAYDATKWERVEGTAYTGRGFAAPRSRPDYRNLDLSPAAKRVGATIVVALRVATAFSKEDPPTLRRLMKDFGMSRETAFRWLNGWILITGQTRQELRNLAPLKPARRPPRRPTPTKNLAPTL